MKIQSILFILLLISSSVFAENLTYDNTWNEEGLSLVTNNDQEIILSYSIKNFGLLSTEIKGENMIKPVLPDVFLPNNEGAPDLPGVSRFIALPEGATAVVEMTNFRTEVFNNIEIAPAPRIPWDTEKGDLEYAKDQTIYGADAYYPQNPVKLSELTEIRGVDAVVCGITPFQYNPVTKELVVFRDIELKITIEGGSGYYGEDRLRSRWWDPLLRDAFINQESIPAMDYNKSFQGTKDSGCEYLIISPNDSEFLSWADTIKNFRTQQGIQTDILTVDDIGGNSWITIQNFVNDAYDNWDVVPAAILILGDYGTNGNNSVIAPIWDNYCASDNIYADVNGNNLPDIIFARITANNEDQLETMITKFLDYERTPPTSESFYNHPITALGWQTERWFQICSESVGGFWRNELGKQPVRINEVYGGNPDNDPWSTASNTYTVLNVFGPNGLGYLPESPSDLGNWAGGNAADVNQAINAGSFMLQHRDHGYEQGWGEPGYSSNNINALTNTDLSFIFSINCLTGKYNLGGECFTEKFHRYKYNGQNSGALGLIAASEVSYSFVNDTYVWGMFDNMWPDFLPQFGTVVDHHGIMPAFGNAAGKFFLHSSAWPYNGGNKVVTHHLFHHHGDAFMTVYSEVPQEMLVLHNDVILEGTGSFTVFADVGAFISLTVNGEIIATAEATGEPLEVAIPQQVAGEEVIITVTKQNYYRYKKTIDVIDSDITYIVQESFAINDNAGNNDGLMDYGETIMLDITLNNIGTLPATNVTSTLSTDSDFITITNGTALFGDFTPGSFVFIEDAFTFEVDHLIPDQENIFFEIESTDGTDTWISEFVIISHAPILEFAEYTINDPSGNNNNWIDPGETVEINVKIANNGSSGAYSVTGELTVAEPGITINTGQQSYGNLAVGGYGEQSFTVVADASIPNGTQIDFLIDITGQGGLTNTGNFMTVIGKYTALVLDLDPINYSGPAIYETFNDMEIYTEYKTSFPEDLGQYKNVFVCLGLHFTNYELSEEEGQILKDYLLIGGNLYMEGRVTWADDPETPVHPMFNINVEDLSMYVIDEVVGAPGSFTDGLSFAYEGNNPVNDYSIEPESPAFSIFTTTIPEQGCMVAYKEGSYRTIGSTVEFGKLVDGASPSTKVELMQKFLNWFDGILTDIEDNNLNSNKGNAFSCFPNPFTSETYLQFDVEGTSEISINIYNLQGQLIKSVADSKFETGHYEMMWDGTNDLGSPVNPGVYVGIMKSGETSSAQRIILTR